MADYKQMYMKLMDAAESAMDILIAAQRQCEEIYIETEDPSDGEDARGGTPKAKETALGRLTQENTRFCRCLSG